MEMENIVSSSQRTATACDECRKNKRKCDGKKPACGLCEKGGKACSYATEGRRKKRKRFDDGYVKDLEEQVRTLTQMLDAKDSSVFDPAEASQSHAQLVPGVSERDNQETRRGGSLPSTDRDPAMAIDARSTEAMEDLGLMMLKLGLRDEGEPNFTISTSEAQTSVSKAQLLINGRDNPTQASDDSRVDPQFRDAELRNHLIDRFCMLFNRFHQVIDDGDATVIRLQYFQNLPDDMLFRNMAVFSIGALYTDTPDAKDLSRSAVESAESLMLRCLKSNVTPLTVQGLTLLSWFYLMVGNDMASWSFNSIATGLVLRLGLHVTALTSTTSVHDNVEQREDYFLRVRTFWCYFSIERMISTVLGMNCTIPWQRVRVKPFATIISNMGGLDERAFSRHGELWHLWDSFMDQMWYAFDWVSMTNPSKHSLMSRSYNALLTFYGESHPDLRCPPSDASDSVICFQLAYHTAILLVYRPFLGDAEGTQTRTLALQGATASALAICRILREYRRGSTLNSLPPQTMSYIVCAAAIHLLNATSGRTGLGRRSIGNLKTCLDALLVVGERWELRKTTSIRFIRKLAHKWKVVWALPMQFCAPLDEEVTILGPGSVAVDNHSVVLQPEEGSLQSYPDTFNFAFDQLQYLPDGGDIVSELDWLYHGESSTTDVGQSGG